MGITGYKIIPMLALALFAANVRVAEAVDDQPLRWNESAKSRVLNRAELGKLRDVLPRWKMKQMVWPSDEELSSAAVAVDEKVRDTCVTWLAKFVDRNQLPPDIKEHLVAMRGWGLVRPELEQRRLCDVFIARFRKGSYTIQIQESPANVVIAVAHEGPARTGNRDHKNLVFSTAALFLKEELRPDPESKRLYIRKEGSAGTETSTVNWQIESVMVETAEGRTAYDGSKAEKLGTWHVTAETNGGYVRFIIHKKIAGPVPPDPYAERFGTTK